MPEIESHALAICHRSHSVEIKGHNTVAATICHNYLRQSITVENIQKPVSIAAMG